MSDAPSLTLLHLSDLHFGQDRGEATSRFDQQLVTQALLRDIRAQVAAGLKPDAVLVTGDIAFSGKPDEYTLAEAWLKQVCEATEISPSQLLLVPGNHDVDRRAATGSFAAKLVHDGLRAKPSGIDDLLKPTNLTQLEANLWPKLAAYADFASRLGGPTLSPAQPFWRHSLANAFGKPVVVLGLNSCLLSFDGNDAPSNLALGLGQLEPAFRNIPDEALVLVLAHHPPEWLVDGAPGGSCKPEHALTTFLQKHRHVLFVGHVHQQGGLVAHPLTSGGLLRFVAGAGHEAAQEGGRHAYAWLRLHAEGIDFYPRMWNADRLHFQPEANRFTLETGKEYIRIKRGKLDDRLDAWLPPNPASPKGISTKRARLSAEYLELLEKRQRLEQAGASREVLLPLKRELLRLKQALRHGTLPAPGDVLDERYLLLEHLRTGGFASVFKAKRLEDGVLVAIKILLPTVAESDELVSRFLRGNEQLQQLAHPRICPILEPLREEPPWDPDAPAGTAGQPRHVYVVLALAEGGDLESWVLKHKPTWKAVVERVLRVAEALEHAHARGCIHRDVKPHNVLLTAQGEEWLTDFDLAKVLDSTLATRTGRLGTPYYAAPEMHESGGIAGPYTDVYGLGMTLFFGLVQQPLGVKHLKNQEAQIEQLQVPERLKAVLKRALESEVSDRYGSMLELRRALEDSLVMGHILPANLVALEQELATLPLAQRLERLEQAGREGDPRLGMDNPHRWVWHPPGSFMMGSESGDSDERPLHRVHIRQGFWLGKYPVTVQEYAAFVEAKGYQTRAWWSDAGWEFIQAQKRVAPNEWTDASLTAPNQPVVGVSWYEAEAFCSWQSRRWMEVPPTRLLEGLKPMETGAPVLRLPSESEWEYAARGEQSRTYPWGDTPEPGPELANFNRNVGFSTPVGAYPQGISWAGAADMAGNVWEWCQDTWHDSYAGAPEDGSAWTSGGDSARRVVRGGSWFNDPGRLRGADRGRSRAGYWGWFRGFRVVLASVPGGVHWHSIL